MLINDPDSNVANGFTPQVRLVAPFSPSELLTAPRRAMRTLSLSSPCL